MNKNFFAGLFMGLGLLGIFAFRPVENEKPSTVQKWEYKVDNSMSLTASKMESKMNTLGAEGWELVIAGGTVLMYKRPLE